MKTFFLLTFSVSVALAPLASAEDQDAAKAPKNRPQVTQKSKGITPQVAPSRNAISQTPKLQRHIPSTSVGPKVQRWQPRVDRPTTTIQSETDLPRNLWRNRLRDDRKPGQTYSPRTRATVRIDANRTLRSRDDQNVTNHWRNRISNNTSWEEARRHRHRDHHHRDWWRSHFTRFALFGSGYYYWDSGYWYPAYGYDSGYNTYAYEEPIYGYNNLAPGQVIANVQTELQRLGYYRNAVDGLMGPATRAAIANYQRDNGLSITSAIDEPTLDSLGLG